MSVPADVERLFARTVDAYGRFDILVNNAGVYHAQPLETVTQQEIDRQLSVNVTGPIRTIQEALKYFGSDGGSVINIGSLDSARAVPGMSVYAATKGAVDALTRVLAAELGPHGIRVNTLAPGGVETEGIHAAGFIGSDAETDMIGRTPWAVSVSPRIWRGRRSSSPPTTPHGLPESASPPLAACEPDTP